MSQNSITEQSSDPSDKPELASVPHLEGDSTPHESDDEPMVYIIPQDYAKSARQQRDILLAEGRDPESIILDSELKNHIHRLKDESAEDFTNRYVETINNMIARGIYILNDTTTKDVMASEFTTSDGRIFDLGPESGVTKGQFRAFSKWFCEVSEAKEGYNVPEKWLKFEKTI